MFGRIRRKRRNARDYNRALMASDHIESVNEYARDNPDFEPVTFTEQMEQARADLEEDK